MTSNKQQSAVILGDPEYVAKLEAKLAKFKKSSEKLRSSDIISEISHHKSSLINRIATGSEQLDPENSSVSRELKYSELTRRVFPEKVALNTEELQPLVKSESSTSSEEATY